MYHLCQFDSSLLFVVPLEGMLPVLFSIGPILVSSFGFFLALGFLFGTFLIWRLARAWDLDEEKILDLSLLTFFGGLIGARLYFALEHFDLFSTDLIKVALITKYPGLSFWGAFLGGYLTLSFFIKRFKLIFEAILDIVAVGFLGGLVLGSLGCFLGGCGVGKESSFFIAVSQVGFVGKRFPIQLIEGLFYLNLLWKIWPKAIHFHTPGKIFSLTLIWIGAVKFLAEFFKMGSGAGYFFSFVLFTLGVTFFYRISKRSFRSDVKSFIKSSIRMITDSQFRASILRREIKSWYNQLTQTGWKIRRLSKFLRRINVKY